MIIKNNSSSMKKRLIKPRLICSDISKKPSLAINIKRRRRLLSMLSKETVSTPKQAHETPLTLTTTATADEYCSKLLECTEPMISFSALTNDENAAGILSYSNTAVMAPNVVMNSARNNYEDDIRNEVYAYMKSVEVMPLEITI